MSVNVRVQTWVANFPPIVWLLGLGSFINVGGLSLIWPVNSIYIHTVLGKPLTVAGLVLMVYSGAGFVGSFCGGWLYDRFGAVPVLALGLLASGSTILLPVFAPSWQVYVAVMALFGTACAIPFPVLNALVGHAWPEGGRRAYNFIYVANNIGVAVGTAVGGLLAEVSFQAVFIGISVCNLGFLLLVLTVFRAPLSNVDRGHTLRHRDDARPTSIERLPVVPWVPIIVMFVGFVLAWGIYVQWQSTISVYMQSLGYSLASYSVLWTLNGLLIFVSQPLMSVVIRRFPSLGVHMVGGVILYAIAYGTLMLSHSYEVFVLGMVITTLGELFVWPSVPAAVAQLTPPHRQGLLQGMVGSAATLGRMIGPVAGGFLYDRVPMTSLLAVLVGSTIVPLACFYLFHRLVHRRDEVKTPTVSA